MKWISVDRIFGGEVLEKDLYSSSGTYIMAAKTVLKPGYRSVFERHGIDRVPIEEVKKEYPETFIEEVLETSAEQVQKVFKGILAGAGDKTQELVQTATTIINNVCREPELEYNLCGIREKSHETFIHTVNVAALSVFVALKMNIAESRVREIAIGALLHDIGYMDIPEANKEILPQNLTEEDRQELRRHVLNGINRLKTETWIPTVSMEIVEKHHEYLDGSGYPFGFSGETIPQEVMIVTVCNLFDSLIYGHFVYRMKAGEALDLITAWAGSRLSLPVVRAFLSSVIIYPIGCTVKLVTGETGIVIMNNANLPLRPVLSIIKDRNGAVCKDQTILNLVDNMTAKIDERLF